MSGSPKGHRYQRRKCGNGDDPVAQGWGNRLLRVVDALVIRHPCARRSRGVSSRQLPLACALGSVHRRASSVAVWGRASHGSPDQSVRNRTSVVRAVELSHRVSSSGPVHTVGVRVLVETAAAPPTSVKTRTHGPLCRAVGSGQLLWRRFLEVLYREVRAGSAHSSVEVTRTVARRRTRRSRQAA